MRVSKHEIKAQTLVDKVKSESEKPGEPIKSTLKPIKQKKSYNYMEFLRVLGGLGLLVGFLWVIGSSANDQTASTISSDKAATLSKLQNDIDSRYSDLQKAAQQMVGDIDIECVWLSDNMSKSIGDYCNDNANSNYGEINTDNWSSSEISYDDTAPLNDIIDTIVSGANNQYDTFLNKARKTKQAMDEECAWLSDNTSGTVGEDCEGSFSFDASSYSTDPFSASDYDKSK